MIKRKKWLIAALLIPIVALLTLAIKHHRDLYLGEEAIFKVVGFDPRDLLSGHYLTYKIDYKIPNLCSLKDKFTVKETYICLNPRKATHQQPKECAKYIKGVCRWDGFEAGIEKFYIPQKYAVPLTGLISNKHGKIVVVVTSSGEAVLKDFLIDDIPWKKYVRDNHPKFK